MKIVLLFMIVAAVYVVEGGKNPECNVDGQIFGLGQGYQENCFKYVCKKCNETKRKKKNCTGRGSRRVWWKKQRICTPNSPFAVPPYVVLDNGPGCVNYNTIQTPDECKIAANAVGFTGKLTVLKRGTAQWGPPGCYVGDQHEKIFFNKKGKKRTGAQKHKSICIKEDKPWNVSFSGGKGAYYDFPAYSSEEAHRVCESTGRVVAEMNSQNELDAVAQYADNNLGDSNAICEEPTEREDCFESDTDYYGNDINLSTARTTDRRNSPSECQTLCSEREGCLYFTWKRTPRECFLKSGGGPAKGNFDAEATSGPRTCGTRVARRRRSSREKRERKRRAIKFTTKHYKSIYVIMKL